MAESKIIIETEQIVCSVAKLANTVSQVADQANEGIESLTRSEIGQNIQVIEAYQDLKDAAEKAKDIVDEVDYITQIGSDKNGMLAIITKLMETTTERKKFWRVRRLFRRSYTSKVPNPDYRCLRSFINRIQKAFSRVEQAHKEFKESLQTAQRTIRNAIENCRHCERQVRQKQRTVPTKGGVTTMIHSGLAGIQVTGALSSSPVFGIVFGILTAVAVGAAGYIATNTLYEQYATLQESFEYQLHLLNNWYLCACEMKENVANVHRAVKRLVIVVEDLEPSHPDQLHINNLCFTLNQMNASFSTMNSTTMECCTTIQMANSKMDTGFKNFAHIYM